MVTVKGKGSCISLGKGCCVPYTGKGRGRVKGEGGNERKGGDRAAR